MRCRPLPSHAQHKLVYMYCVV
uniref:Uncharacterized protein n=1 Tax=Rhizophora mucronata TaxID=61149 RepID=A0A2P2MQZ6_RHIMU